MKSPFHHIKYAEQLFDHFHKKLHHAFAVFGLAIIGMLRGASHILTPTTASRQWGGFITNDFREQNPSDGNIKYALFGDGTTGSTAYTRTWSTSCIPTSVQYLSTLNGLTGAADTIYVINSGTYTLTYPITLTTCSALIGRGDVYLKPANSSVIPVKGYSKTIIDNIKINGNNQTYTGMTIAHLNNMTLNNIDIYQSLGQGLYTFSIIGNVVLNNSRIYNNDNGILLKSNLPMGSSSPYITINNLHIYNNNVGIHAYNFNIERMTINNSQIYNNSYGILFGHTATCVTIPCLSCTLRDYNNSINNSTIYNNGNGIYTENCFPYSDGSTTDYTYTYNLNNTKIYNNTNGIMAISNIPSLHYYGTLNFFSNSHNTGGINTLTPGSGSPIRSDGTLDEASTTINYDHVTNPQNGSGLRLLSGNLTLLRGVRVFNAASKPIRYIFGLNIPKQEIPVWYDNNIPTAYGSNGSDYFTTRYIAEPDSTLPLNQQALVNQYFGSGSTFTQNRQTNGCSLSAFQVKVLGPNTFNNTNNTFEDHTIYILTGGEYRSIVSSGFVFNGNCIALIGNNDTRFTKLVAGINSILYANNKRNIIIDTIKVDGLYYSNTQSLAAQSAIKFDGASNNSTINNVQAYNAAAYGIYLGLSSHHNTIINTQAFNNGSAGINLYYASNYNVINNTQTYNNVNYGIRFANGSSRNTMNNFQAYNNDVGVFGDLTTQENILNRAAIYNNSDAGIYFKNASGNSLNDVKIYHNDIGIKTLYSSMGNKYYGDLKLFDNISANFDGTNGSDSNLSAGTAGLFPYAGVLSTGTSIITCLDATNPVLSGNGLSLLTNGTCSNMGFILSFVSEHNTYVNYAFGLNMYKQKIPVRYDSGNALIQIPSQYDANKYIAEVFAIRDDTPEGMTFASSGSVELNTRYTTNVYTAGVLNVAVPVTLSFTGDSNTSGYLIISGTNVGLTGIVNNGNTIQISILSRTGYNETVTGSITVGSVTTGFTVTTRGLSQTPTTGSFAFANLTSIPVNTFTGSTTTISGIETGVLASITFAPVTTSGRLEIYSGTTLTSSGTTGLTVYNGNQVKAIAQSSSGYAQTVTGYVTIGLGTGLFTIMTKGSDSIPPTVPTITYPLSGEELFFVTFQRVASTDTGSGIEGYEYEIAEDSNFLDVVNTGFIATVTGTMGSPNTEFDANSDTYYWRLQARDRDGNLSTRSNIGSFEAVEFDGRNFNEKTNANLRTYYDSKEITLEGIKPGLTVRASVDEDGTLYKNGTDKGTGSRVQNGDDLYITVRSSNTYDRTVSSTLTIANRELEFNVTTKEESDDGCTLSDDDKTTIQEIFDSLVANYSGDENRYDEFLYTLQSMLSDEIDFTNDCNLQYLEDLINGEIGGNVIVDTGTHIAPNCKEYSVNFDNARMAYTSPTFKVIAYFANRDSLARYIDSKNPGDCHINTYGASSWIFTNNDPSKHIASNGKLYTITNDGQGYTSPEFAVTKHFSTISALRTYIDGKNPPQEIRSHQVDTSFTPQTYLAPNGKEYTIYKTDRGYMSYKLMKVRYFSTLADIQYFISRNNQR